MYLTAFTHVLQDQAIFFSESDDHLSQPIVKSCRSGRTAVQTVPMFYAYFHIIYKDERQHVSSHRDAKVLWNDDSKHSSSLFVGFLLFFSNKTASPLSSLVFVACSLFRLF